MTSIANQRPGELKLEVAQCQMQQRAHPSGASQAAAPVRDTVPPASADMALQALSRLASPAASASTPLTSRPPVLGHLSGLLSSGSRA